MTKPKNSYVQLVLSWMSNRELKNNGLGKLDSYFPLK